MEGMIPNYPRGLQSFLELAHLDSSCPITISKEGVTVQVTVQEVVRAVDKANYGLHRFLSGIVFLTEGSDDPQRQKLSREVAELLENGLF